MNNDTLWVVFGKVSRRQILNLKYLFSKKVNKTLEVNKCTRIHEKTPTGIPGFRMHPTQVK